LSNAGHNLPELLEIEILYVIFEEEIQFIFYGFVYHPSQVLSTGDFETHADVIVNILRCYLSVPQVMSLQDTLHLCCFTISAKLALPIVVQSIDSLKIAMKSLDGYLIAKVDISHLSVCLNEV
jgi:hypothetical protein